MVHQSLPPRDPRRRGVALGHVDPGPPAEGPSPLLVVEQPGDVGDERAVIRGHGEGEAGGEPSGRDRVQDLGRERAPRPQAPCSGSRWRGVAARQRAGPRRARTARSSKSPSSCQWCAAASAFWCGEGFAPASRKEVPGRAACRQAATGSPCDRRLRRWADRPGCRRIRGRRAGPGHRPPPAGESGRATVLGTHSAPSLGVGPSCGDERGLHQGRPAFEPGGGGRQGAEQGAPGPGRDDASAIAVADAEPVDEVDDDRRSPVEQRRVEGATGFAHDEVGGDPVQLGPQPLDRPRQRLGSPSDPDRAPPPAPGAGARPGPTRCVGSSPISDTSAPDSVRMSFKVVTRRSPRDPSPARDERWRSGEGTQERV